jgi:hypothetical protein
MSSYTTQDSNSSMDEIFSNTIQDGSIDVRMSRKVVPTLETGRRSKNLVLVGEEAARRERRRERNREAARKLKEKRQLVEEELNQKIKDLENQHLGLEKYLLFLQQRKQLLQNEVNNVMIDPIDELLSNENPEMLLFFEQYSDEMDSFDESINSILNFDLNISLNSIPRD